MIENQIIITHKEKFCLKSSLEKIVAIGPDDINSAEMYIKFGCVPQIIKKGVSA